jgi:hypothetical protein
MPDAQFAFQDVNASASGTHFCFSGVARSRRCEPTVYKMWDAQHLATLEASAASYEDVAKT